MMDAAGKPDTFHVGMPVFYVNSNISPKNDDGKEADYIVENFCAWKEVTI